MKKSGKKGDENKKDAKRKRTRPRCCDGVAQIHTTTGWKKEIREGVLVEALRGGKICDRGEGGRQRGVASPAEVAEPLADYHRQM